MKEIELTRSHIAIVDDDDYYDLKGYNWHAVTIKSKIGERHYAATNIPFSDNKRKGRVIYLHRLILSIEGKSRVWFLNNDSLDCRKSNLTISNPGEMIDIRVCRIDSLSKEKGIEYHLNTGRYQVGLMHPVLKKTIYGGIYSNIDDARISRDNLYNRLQIEAMVYLQEKQNVKTIYCN